MVLDSGLHARDSGFQVQVKIFRILESGLPYIGQGVVADIHRRGTDLEVYLLVSFRDICLYFDAARAQGYISANVILIATNT